MAKFSKSRFWARKLAKTLKQKGLVAYYGRGWEGSTAYHDPEFWYFHTCENGQIGVYVEYDSGTYDTGVFIEREHFRKVQERVVLLGDKPHRDEIWKAIREFVQTTHARSSVVKAA